MAKKLTKIKTPKATGSPVGKVTTTSVDPETLASRSHIGWLRMNVRKGSLLGIGVISAVFLIGLVQIYVLGWSNAFTAALANVVPLQAGLVNGHGLSAAAYYSVEQPYRALNKKSSQSYTNHQLAQAAFGVVASQTLVQAYALDHKLSVSNDELNASMDRLAEASGGVKQLAKQVQTDYAMSLSGYRDQVRQRLLAAKVDQALREDPQRVASARSLAQGALKDVAASPAKPGAVLLKASQLPPEVAKVGAGLSDGTAVLAPILVNHVFYALNRVSTTEAGPQYSVMTFPVPGLSVWLGEQQGAGANLVKYLPQTR